MFDFIVPSFYGRLLQREFRQMAGSESNIQKKIKKHRRNQILRCKNSMPYSVSIATCEDADDLRAGIMNLAERCDARLDLRFEVFRRSEVATLQERRLRLVRCEEIPHGLEELLRLRFLLAEKDVTCDVTEFRKNVQERMSFWKQCYDGIVVVGELLRAQVDDIATSLDEDLAQAILDGLHFLEFAVLAMV